MALAAIQASYNDEDDEKSTSQYEDNMAVLNDPTFSVMSKIKLNLTPTVMIQVMYKLKFLYENVKNSSRIIRIYSL